jgi:hypothetical protein
MRLLKTILLSLLTLAQIALCAEDYYKVRPRGIYSRLYVLP